MALWKRKQPIEVGSPDSTGELDKYSGTWKFVESWAIEQIQKLREKNDNVNMTEVQTSVIRGRLKALKDLLELSKDKRGILQ